MSEWRRAANRTRKDGPHAAIVAALRQIGASVYVGGPLDLIVGFRRRTIMLEIKSKGGKLTPAQGRFLGTWAGDDCVIVRSVDEAVAALVIARRVDEALTALVAGCARR